MIQTGKVVHRQIPIGKIVFEATCLVSDQTGKELILRYPDQRKGLNDPRLSAMLGKRIRVKGGTCQIEGYPIDMLSLDPTYSIEELTNDNQN